MKAYKGRRQETFHSLEAYVAKTDDVRFLNSKVEQANLMTKTRRPLTPRGFRKPLENPFRYMTSKKAYFDDGNLATF